MKPCYILYIVSFGFHFWGLKNLLLKVALLGISVIVKVNVGVSTVCQYLGLGRQYN